MRRVLVACEFSGTVRDAFARLGWDAWSCDLLPSDKPGKHVRGDCLKILQDRWDLLIAHPPCTFLAVSANRWMKPEYAHRFPDRPRQREEALEFVQALMDAPCPHICIENPVSVISSRIRKPDQTIQPWQFGHGEVKRTCLWLKNLPKLKSTNVVSGREARLHRLPPAEDRWRERSKTFQGIADAMAHQWTNHIEDEEVWS